MQHKCRKLMCFLTLLLLTSALAFGVDKHLRDKIEQELETRLGLRNAETAKKVKSSGKTVFVIQQPGLAASFGTPTLTDLLTNWAVFFNVITNGSLVQAAPKSDVLLPPGELVAIKRVVVNNTLASFYLELATLRSSGNSVAGVHAWVQFQFSKDWLKQEDYDAMLSAIVPWVAPQDSSSLPAATVTALPAIPIFSTGASGTASQPSSSPIGAVIHTTAGDIKCTLYPDKAPKAVANFVGLAEGTKDWRDPRSGVTQHGTPLYRSTVFHRVIPNFLIQGGDPAGTGVGSPGFAFEDEVSPDLIFDRPGRLAMANSGPNTNGSQFFITEVAVPRLDGGYTIFGQCDTPAVELVKEIARRPRDTGNDRPFQPVQISNITILRSPTGEGDVSSLSGGNSAESAGQSSVQLQEGQTPEEVGKLLGKPTDTMTLKGSLIYIYPTVKVIFENGKLVDVQEKK